MLPFIFQIKLACSVSQLIRLGNNSDDLRYVMERLSLIKKHCEKWTRYCQIVDFQFQTRDLVVFLRFERDSIYFIIWLFGEAEY